MKWQDKPIRCSVLDHDSLLCVLLEDKVQDEGDDDDDGGWWWEGGWRGEERVSRLWVMKAQ